MNISGIQPYSGLYDYNSIKTNEASSYQLHQVVPVEMHAGENGQEQQNQEISSDTAQNQSFTASDYARQYQPDATYEMSGADSNLQNLDMTQAISDMQKDQVLQQYQFFIGESQGQGGTSFAGTDATASRAVENFSL